MTDLSVIAEAAANEEPLCVGCGKKIAQTMTARYHTKEKDLYLFKKNKRGHLDEFVFDENIFEHVDMATIDETLARSKRFKTHPIGILITKSRLVTALPEVEWDHDEESE